MADTPTTEARLQRIERAQNEVTRLARGPHRSGGRSFRMTVPVDPADSDIVLIDGLNAGREAIIEAEAPEGSVLVTEEALTAALVEVEESKLSAHPECLTDECDHEKCPDWAALGCGDAAAILAQIREAPRG